jgi:hypothetical protein
VPAITAPGNYSWSRTRTLTLSGTAQAGATVEVFDGATSYGAATAALNGTWSRIVTVPADGAYVFAARARNLAGGSPSSAARVIQVDSRPPNPPVITGLVSPSTLVGTAEAGTTVELFENGSSRGTVSAANGTWSRTLSSPAGTYTARATDFAGNRSALSAAYVPRP